jgi:hypothetical protein
MRTVADQRRTQSAIQRLSTIVSTGASPLVDDNELGREVLRTYQIVLYRSANDKVCAYCSVASESGFPFSAVLRERFECEALAVLAIGRRARHLAETPNARRELALRFIYDLLRLYEAALARSLLSFKRTDTASSAAPTHSQQQSR